MLGPGAPGLGVLGLGRAGGSLVATARSRGVVVVAKSRRLGPLARHREWLALRPLFLAVPDDAIAEVAAQLAALPALPAVVVHMSGAKGASALAAIAGRCAIGTFHPLASLDGTHVIPIGTFVAIDASSPALEKQLVALAKHMQLVPGIVKERDRVRYHAGAVVAGNLATALLHEGVELLVRSGVKRAQARVSLARLLASTAHNAIARDLSAALTGPVARGDVDTITRHVTLLDREDPDLAALYRKLSLVLVDDVSAHPAATRKRLRAALSGARTAASRRARDPR